jgi:hypothetical protein
VGAAVEDIISDLVDVLLKPGDHGTVVVDDTIDDRVHDRDRSAAQEVWTRLQAVADACQVGRLAMSHGDHVLRSGEHVHLTEFDGLALIDVPRRAQYQEHHVAIALQLGTLMSLDRILHRERVQIELLSDGIKLRRIRPAKTDPRDPVAAPAGGVQRCQALRRSDSLAITIDSAVNNYGPSLRGCQGPGHAVYAPRRAAPSGPVSGARILN